MDRLSLVTAKLGGGAQMAAAAALSQAACLTRRSVHTATAAPHISLSFALMELVLAASLSAVASSTAHHMPPFCARMASVPNLLCTAHVTCHTIRLQYS